MKIEIKNIINGKTKRFGDLKPGDAFYELDTPQEPYIKICDSHGDADGAGFTLMNFYEEEFDDEEIVGIYTDSQFIGVV